MAASLSPYHALMPARWEALSALPPVSAVPGTKAAVLVPVYEADGRLRLIMTRRPVDMRSHPGDVVFPGGMIDPADAGPVDTALREAAEEVGLGRDDVVQILGGLTPVHTRSVTMRIVPVVARVHRPATLVAQPEEVSAILEPSIDELLDDDRWQSRFWGPGRHMWFYQFPEGVLWGATAMMVRELLGYFRRDVA